MVDGTSKKRLRRVMRVRKRQLEGFGQNTEASLDQHFFKRLGRLYDVRRFIIGWVLLLILLIGSTVIQTRSLGSYYQALKPIEGGIYSEGMVGSFTNANPLFASSDVDLAVSRLVFNGLLKYNGKQKLVGDLADSWDIDPSGKIYTITLRKNLVWQDGKPLTADDVAFTITTIQNPDVRSPFFASWQGVVVKAVNATTVSFTLPNVFASFPHSLTIGIVPKHLLSGIGASNLRSALFNTTQPIGSGPFKWLRVEVRGDTVNDHEQRIAFLPNSSYYASAPRVSEFIMHTFLGTDKMLKNFKAGELTAMAGLETVPKDIANMSDIDVRNIPVNGSVTAFLRTTQDALKDVAVRQSLVMATNRLDILKDLAYPSMPVEGPFLRNQIGYNPATKQLPYNILQANALLDKAGWVRGPDGNRAKAGKKLQLSLNTLNRTEYKTVADALIKQWQEIGVQLVMITLENRDLQAAIDNRTYDVLLYGISLGADSDQFAYWHSSQADIRSPQRLNFSDYSSPVADQSLQAGRTRIDPQLRSAKYKPFLDAWRNDVPAITLYQPRYLYVTRGPVSAPMGRQFITPADHFYNVQDWTVRVARTTK